MIPKGTHSQFLGAYSALSIALSRLREQAERATASPTETAEAVSLVRYRLERIATLLGCEQTRPPTAAESPATENQTQPNTKERF